MVWQNYSPLQWPIYIYIQQQCYNIWAQDKWSSSQIIKSCWSDTISVCQIFIKLANLDRISQSEKRGTIRQAQSLISWHESRWNGGWQAKQAKQKRIEPLRALVYKYNKKGEQFCHAINRHRYVIKTTYT